MRHGKRITFCKHEKAASRYNFGFLLHAAQTAFRITVGMVESSAVIATWQHEHSEASASRTASFPWNDDKEINDRVDFF
jgi:hypothetical protein